MSNAQFGSKSLDAEERIPHIPIPLWRNSKVDDDFKRFLRGSNACTVAYVFVATTRFRIVLCSWDTISWLKPLYRSSSPFRKTSMHCPALFHLCTRFGRWKSKVTGVSGWLFRSEYAISLPRFPTPRIWMGYCGCIQVHRRERIRTVFRPKAEDVVDNCYEALTKSNT